MKDLMEKVFETLYERDSEQLGEIIDAFGYFDKDEEEKKTYDFEKFMEKIEAIAKENNIEMEDVATRIVNVCEISGNNIDEMLTKLKEIKPEQGKSIDFESIMSEIAENVNSNKFEASSIAIAIIARYYFTEDQQTNAIKEMLIDEIEDGSMEPKDIKRIIEKALGSENYKKIFYENVEEKHIHHLINEEEQGLLEKVLGEFNFYHDDRTEEEKTKEYGKLYIEQLIKDKNSEEAIKIAEQLRSNQLLPDGEETVVALCKTNFEQVVDTIMSTVTPTRMYQEVKKQYLKTTNEADNDIIILDITEPQESTEEFLKIQSFEEEVVKQLVTSDLEKTILKAVEQKGLSRVEDEINSYYEKEQKEPKRKEANNILALDLTNITYAAKTVLDNTELRREIKRLKKERKLNG